MQRVAALSITASLVPALVACGDSGTAQAPAALPVEATVVAEERFTEELNTVSTLESVEKVALAARAGGRIERILVQEGDAVQQGQLLVVLDQTQTQAQLAAARATMEQNKLDYKRFQWLAQQGAASDFQRDRFREAFIQSREQVRASEADLAFKDLRAPISGVVSDVDVKVGDVISEGTPFTRLIRNDRLQARVDVPAVYAPRVRIGQTVDIQSPGGGGTLASGRVSFVDPNVVADTQGLLVMSEFPNPGQDLRNGMRLRTRLVFDTREQLAVPFNSVIQTSGQSFIFRLGSLEDLRAQPGQLSEEQLAQLPADGTFALQTPVQLGFVQGDSYPVIKGVSSGEQVITTNLLKLRHGTPVEVK
ncbi:efflux RND transporter periplasmic adaptor subunit [Synechococcus sp. RSCCF101]|nr:efflux RND transporter periplasmic adaptor subunit [Synechococcus sp. RSCCF101]